MQNQQNKLIRNGPAGNTPLSAAAPIDAYPLVFTGSGGSFARLWLANLVRKIFTLGMYQPWARRRVAMYLHGHTLVADSPLEFTASQRRMTKGFLIFVVLYLAYKLAVGTGQTLAAGLFLFGGALLAPLLWTQAMRFRLSSTRWRGIQIRFSARWLDIYRASWPMLALALLWLGVVRALTWLMGNPGPATTTDALRHTVEQVWPSGLAVVVLAMVLSFMCLVRLEYNYRNLLVKFTQVGGHGGRWRPHYGDFVRIWIGTGALLLGGALLVGLLGVGLAQWLMPHGGGHGMTGGRAFVLGLLSVLTFLLALLAGLSPARAYREARLFRLTWNHAGLGQVARFKCRLNVRAYVFLRIRNLLLTLLTLGFYRPFALVAEYRMKIESLTLYVKGGLDQLVDRLQQDQPDGLGDALADAVGMDMLG